MNPQREPQPTVEMPPASLPSFITAAPRTPTPAEALDAPQPVVEAPVAETRETAEAPVAAAVVGDDAPQEPRGRRRRLRSPYGFRGAGGDDTPAAPGNGSSSE